MAIGMSVWNGNVMDVNTTTTTTRQRITSEHDLSWLNIDDEELEDILTESIGADTPRVTSDEIANLLFDLNEGDSGVTPHVQVEEARVPE